MRDLAFALSFFVLWGAYGGILGVLTMRAVAGIPQLVRVAAGASVLGSATLAALTLAWADCKFFAEFALSTPACVLVGF